MWLLKKLLLATLVLLVCVRYSTCVTPTTTTEPPTTQTVTTETVTTETVTTETGTVPSTDHVTTEVVTTATEEFIKFVLNLFVPELLIVSHIYIICVFLDGVPVAADGRDSKYICFKFAGQVNVSGYSNKPNS